jgi:hypothetical protein
MITKGKFGDFWNDITTLIRFELDKIKKERDEENIHSEVMPELLASFEVSYVFIFISTCPFRKRLSKN